MRTLQDIGLPLSAQEILYEKYQNVVGEVHYLPRYEKRIRGYTSRLWFNQRVPLFEYVYNPKYDGDEGYLLEVRYYEEFQDVVWSSGPMVFKQLCDSDGDVVCMWPVDEDGSIMTDDFLS